MKGGEGVGEVLYECYRCDGLRWDAFKEQPFRRSSKVQVFTGIKDTAVTHCYQWTSILWWGYKETNPVRIEILMASSEALSLSLVTRWVIAHTQQSFTHGQVLAQGFTEGSHALPPSFSCICCGKYFPSFMWCNLSSHKQIAHFAQTVYILCLITLWVTEQH